MCEDGDTTLEPAHAFVASQVMRRTGMPDGQVRAHFTIPVVDSAPRPPRLVVLERTADKPALRIAFSVSSGSSRGPPRC